MTSLPRVRLDDRLDRLPRFVGAVQGEQGQDTVIGDVDAFVACIAIETIEDGKCAFVIGGQVSSRTVDSASWFAETEPATRQASQTSRQTAMRRIVKGFQSEPYPDGCQYCDQASLPAAS
jgi:hypothetical protein